MTNTKWDLKFLYIILRDTCDNYAGCHKNHINIQKNTNFESYVFFFQ